MRLIAIILALGVACCSASKPETIIAMMGEVSAKPFTEGFIGCEWKPQKRLKLNPPLEGWLKFNIADCGPVGRPAFGYKKNFT